MIRASSSSRRIGSGVPGRLGQREALETGRLDAPFRRIGPGEVTENGVVRLPEGVRSAQLRHGGVLAHDVTRHRQCEAGLVVRRRIGPGLLPGGEPIADRVGCLVEGLEDLHQTLLPGRPRALESRPKSWRSSVARVLFAACCCASRRSISRTSIWSSVRISLSLKVFSSCDTAWYCCALRRTSISDRRCVASAWIMKTRALAARALRSVPGKSLTIRSSSFLASGYQPASIKNRITRSRSAAFFGSTRPSSAITTGRGTWSVSTTPSQNPSIPRYLDHVRPDLDDRLLHARPADPAGSRYSGTRRRPRSSHGPVFTLRTSRGIAPPCTTMG